MGIQASTIKTAAGKLAFESKKKGSKFEKVRIEILAFEVANVMSKAVQLWQSLSEQEILRLTTEVVKSEGVLNLVSDNESVLLSLACMEKLQDLTSVAFAVARLGKRCHEPALLGFEHIYNDILKQNIDVLELAFPYKEMEAKVKKMERYICTTCNLYQELEILSEMEQALRRLQDEDDPAQKDNLYALEQKAVWQRQEIKYLKEISLWNRTYDKIVGLLARTVCTIYGRIIKVFGFPVVGWPHILSVPKSGEIYHSGSIPSRQEVEQQKPGNSSLNGSVSSVHPRNSSTIQPVCGHEPYSAVPASNGVAPSSGGRNTYASSSNGNVAPPHYPSGESYLPLSFCFSPGRHFSQQKGMSISHMSRDGSPGSSPIAAVDDEFATGNTDFSGCMLPNNGLMGQLSPNQNGCISIFSYNPKSKLQNAPLSTLGGAALALHYANVIIIVEKMVRYPHLISQDARDDLYQMLPKNVRTALRARLRSCTRGYGSPKCNGAHAAEWKEVLERVLGWLAPLAHNMIRWQSEHNFEQQQVVSRTNVLLLQTLYFADQAKAEAAMTELLVGLNFLWRHERDSKASSLMEYASNKDLDEYLEWQL